MRKDGKGAADIDKAARKVEAEYELPFLAHATLEPVNCTAEIINGECHITGPIQFQQGRSTVLQRVLACRRKRSSFTPRFSAVATAASWSSTSRFRPRKSPRQPASQ